MGGGARRWGEGRTKRERSANEARDREWGDKGGQVAAGGLAVAGYESQLPIRVFASLGQEVAVRILLVAAAAGMPGFAAPVLLSPTSVHHGGEGLRVYFKARRGFKAAATWRRRRRSSGCPAVTERTDQPACVSVRCSCCVSLAPPPGALDGAAIGNHAEPSHGLTLTLTSKLSSTPPHTWSLVGTAKPTDTQSATARSAPRCAICPSTRH